MLRRIVRGFSRSSLVTAGSLALFVATTVVNVASFAFHLVVSRQLDPGSYGALGALVGVLVVLTVPSSALQVAITREVAARHVDPDQEPPPVIVGPLLGTALVWGISATLILVLVSPLVKSFLHLPTLTSAILLAIFVLPTAIELVPKAVLMGEMHFGRVALALVAGSIVRLGLVYPLSQRRGIDGAMAATVLGAVVTQAFLLTSLRPYLRKRVGLGERDGGEPLRVHWRDGTGALLAFSGYWVLVTVDTVMARHFLSPTSSGLYAAASLAARSVMFLPGAVAMVAFPRFAASAGKGLQARKALLQSLFAVTVIGLLAAILFTVVPSLIIGTLFPSAYGASTHVLGVLALSAASVGTVSVLMYFHLASRSRMAASLPWVAVLEIVVGVWIFHGSLSQIALVTLLSNLVVLALMAWPVFGTRPRDRENDGVFVNRDLWELTGPQVDVTMVIPFYNPGSLLQQNVENLVSVLTKTDASFEIIAVSDGSTDESDSALGQFGELVRVVRLASNQGKGAALRTGLAMGRGRYIGFIDADGDVVPGSLSAFLTLVRLYEPDVILGSKRHPMSEVEYPTLRRIYSWGYQQLVRVLFHLNLRDTQTGLKLVKREALAQILPRMVEKRFAFDLELFVVGRHLGFTKYFEAPVHIRHQFTSTVSWRSVRGTLLDTLAIYYRLHILRFYDDAGRPLTDDEARAAADESIDHDNHAIA